VRTLVGCWCRVERDQLSLSVLLLHHGIPWLLQCIPMLLTHLMPSLLAHCVGCPVQT